MSDREIAYYLRDMMSRRLSGRELALCSYVADGEELHQEDRRWFDSLKTQFAAELSRATIVPASIETNDQTETLL